MEGEDGLEVSLEDMPPAHPFPAEFQWFKDGAGSLQNNSRMTFGYPSLTIDNVQRIDSGLYSLTATNFFFNESKGVLGTETGSVTVDVLCKGCLLLLLLLLFVGLFVVGLSGHL